MTLTMQRKPKKGAMPSLIDREQFIMIWGFMLVDFKLEKTELLVYAVIFSIYNHSSYSYVGSREYLQSWAGAGKTAVDEALASLEKKQLIIKEYKRYGRSTKAVYSINTEMLPTTEMFALENRYRDNCRKIREGFF